MEVNLPNALGDIHMIRFVLLLKHWNRVAKERRGMNGGCTKETGLRESVTDEYGDDFDDNSMCSFVRLGLKH